LQPGNANSASLITTSTTNFNNILSSLDSTVQAAFDTLDDGAVKAAASSTDNAIMRFDGTGGNVSQNSGNVIDDSNNIGVGTTSPTTYLYGTTGVAIYDTDTPGLSLAQDKSGSNAIDWLIWNNADDLNFFSSGNNHDAPTGSLKIKFSANGAITAAQVYATGVGGTNRDMYIDNTGLMGYVVSSIRYKENVRDIQDGFLAYNLRPVRFDYKDKSKGVDQVGFIAEEVAKVIPEAVSYDNDSKPETVNSSKLIPILTAAIQELNDRVKYLERQIK
jgi:hypothetical protein